MTQPLQKFHQVEGASEAHICVIDFEGCGVEVCLPLPVDAGSLLEATSMALGEAYEPHSLL